MTAPELERMNAIRAELAAATAHAEDEEAIRHRNKLRNLFRLNRTTLRSGQTLEWRDTVARAMVLELAPHVSPAVFADALTRATQVADNLTDTDTDSD